MSELIFDEIERTAAYLKLNINAQEIADVMLKNKYSDEHAEAISGFLLYLTQLSHPSKRLECLKNQALYLNKLVH